MANTYHYYGVKDNYAWHFVCPTMPGDIKHWQPRLILESDIVWCQGPRGGVKIVQINWALMDFRKLGYITTDPKEMKEFMWVKLRAVTLGSNGTEVNILL